METILAIFGEGKDLNTLQMCSRAFVIFIITWLYIRIAGRRSFGLKRPLDNIIVILLGSILSRAVAGASPFFPTIAACLLIVLLHRLCAYISIHNKKFSQIVNGRKMLLFENGVFHRENMERALVHEEDIHEQVRLKALMNTMEKIDVMYMEKNGEISSIKKEQ